VDVRRKLDELLPPPGQAPTAAMAKQLLALLPMLTKHEHAQLLALLPDRLAAIPPDSVFSTATQTYIDTVGLQCLVGYTRHVRPGEIAARVDGKSQKGPAAAMRRLAGMLSADTRARLWAHLVTAAAPEVEAALAQLFQGALAGTLDLAVEELGKQAHGHDTEVLAAIQTRRRRDPGRLPAKPARTVEVRFLVEEIRRELFVYVPPDARTAAKLIDRVLAWFEGSKLRSRTLPHAEVYLLESGFFRNLASVGNKLRLGSTIKPYWDATIAGLLASSRFWVNIAGLNGEIELADTEAGTRETAYRSGAKVTAAVVVLATLALVGAGAATRVPGIVRGVINWVEGGLVISAQYAHATYRTYGLVAGMGVAARDAFIFALQRPIELTEGAASATELVLDLVGAESGLAPGTSPADVYSSQAARMAKAAKHGLSTLIDEANDLRRAAKTEIAAVEFHGHLPSGTTVKVVADIVDYDAGKIRVAVKNVQPDAAHASEANVIRFISREPPAAADKARALGNTTAERPQLALPPARISASATRTAATIGADAEQVEKVANLLGRPLTEGKGELAKIWRRCAAKHADRIREVQAMFSDRRSKDIAERARKVFGDVRDDFWKDIATGQDTLAKTVRDQFNHAGFEFTTAGAPSVQLGSVRISLDVDHRKELGQFAADALSGKNLRLATPRENRIVLNQLTSQDAFLQDARKTLGRGRSRAGRIRGPFLLSAPGDTAVHEQAVDDVAAAVEAALRRLDDPDFEL